MPDGFWIVAIPSIVTAILAAIANYQNQQIKLKQLEFEFRLKSGFENNDRLTISAADKIDSATREVAEAKKEVKDAGKEVAAAGEKLNGGPGGLLERITKLEARHEITSNNQIEIKTMLVRLANEVHDLAALAQHPKIAAILAPLKESEQT